MERVEEMLFFEGVKFDGLMKRAKLQKPKGVSFCHFEERTKTLKAEKMGFRKFRKSTNQKRLDFADKSTLLCHKTPFSMYKVMAKRKESPQLSGSPWFLSRERDSNFAE